VSLDLDQVKQFEKLYKKVYSVIENFLKNHIELAFLKFDHSLIQNILAILMRGINDEYIF